MVEDSLQELLAMRAGRALKNEVLVERRSSLDASPLFPPSPFPSLPTDPSNMKRKAACFKPSNKRVRNNEIKVQRAAETSRANNEKDVERECMRKEGEERRA